MATREVAEWEKVDAANNFPSDEGGWEEGMKRSDVNNSARANMGSVRRWYDAPEWLDLTGGAAVTRIDETSFSIPGDFASYFNDGRRIKMTGGSTDPWYATVDGDAVFTAVTTVNVKDFSSGIGIPDTPAPTLVFLNIIAETPLGDQIFITVPILTGVAIQAAVDQAESDGGGIIILEPNAEYAIDAQINIGWGATPGKIRMLGRGAILKAEAALDEPIFSFFDQLGGQIELYTTVEDVIFDGDASTQTGGDNDGVVEIGTNISYVTLRNCIFRDTHGHGVKIKTDCDHIWIETCTFLDNGVHGISMADANSTITDVYVRGCSFSNPSARTSATLGAAIKFAGKCSISDCEISGLDHATDTQIGIWAKPKTAASPTDSSGHDSTIDGISIEGIGLNARGIDCEGRDNVFSNCTIRLTGAGSEGIQVHQTFGGGISDHNTFTGINIIDAETGINFESDAHDNIANGCNIYGTTSGYTDAGQRNLFTGCRIDNATDGIAIEASAVDATVLSSLITASTSDGVVVTAGALRTQLLLNAVTNSTTNDYVDDGTETGLAKVSHFYNQLLFPDAGSHTAVTLDESDGTEYIIEDAWTTFGIYADGVNVWYIDPDALRVHVKFTNQVSDQNVTFRLRMGDNRLLTPSNDLLIASEAGVMTDTVDPTNVIVDFSGMDPVFIVPDAANDDELYITAERTSGLGVADSDVEIIGEDTAGDGTYILVRLREQND